MTFDQAVKRLSRTKRFMASVYAMNSLLLDQKVYSASDYERLFVEWAEKELRRRVAVRKRRPRARQ